MIDNNYSYFSTILDNKNAFLSIILTG